jgi:hypothetical protein
MKVRIRRYASMSVEDEARIHAALQQLQTAVDPVTGARQRFEPLAAIKARTDLVALMSFHLEDEPEQWIGDEARFTCFRPENHNHGDEHPSLWCRQEHSSGAPRCGCHPCGWAGDAVDFFRKLHRCDYKTACEMLRYWDHGQRPRITIRLRRKSSRAPVIKVTGGH